MAFRNKYTQNNAEPPNQPNVDEPQHSNERQKPAPQTKRTHIRHTKTKKSSKTETRNKRLRRWYILWTREVWKDNALLYGRMTKAKCIIISAVSSSLCYSCGSSIRNIAQRLKRNYRTSYIYIYVYHIINVCLSFGLRFTIWQRQPTGRLETDQEKCNVHIKHIINVYAMWALFSAFLVCAALPVSVPFAIAVACLMRLWPCPDRAI